VNRRRRTFAQAITLLLVMLVTVVLVVPVKFATVSAAAADKKLIIDNAKLLTPEQVMELRALAVKYGEERETDFIIITTNEEGVDAKKLTQDFYDEQAPGYDKKHGNAAIMTVDMKKRYMYIAGFYKAKEYIDDARVEKILDKVYPYAADNDYYGAFKTYLTVAHEYMGIKPGVNPDNILFNIWFQLIVALLVGGVVVWIMIRNSGGRVTVNRQTYEDQAASGILGRQDQYINTTVTKRKIERDKGGGSGGGGGTTSGGHSHSGGGRSF